MNGDQISRQAAIDEIRTMQTYKLFAGDDMLLVDKAEAMTNLMMMPTAEPRTGKWIPVTKRLPEESGKYLVTVSNGNVYAGTFSAFEKRFSCAAIAWMPLPAPYEEESDG